LCALRFGRIYHTTMHAVEYLFFTSIDAKPWDKIISQHLYIQQKIVVAK